MKGLASGRILSVGEREARAAKRKAQAEQKRCTLHRIFYQKLCISKEHENILDFCYNLYTRTLHCLQYIRITFVGFQIGGRAQTKGTRRGSS